MIDFLKLQVGTGHFHLYHEQTGGIVGDSKPPSVPLAEIGGKSMNSTMAKTVFVPIQFT